MKFIFLILISTPVFACKMTPEVGRRRAADAAKKAVELKTGQKDLHVRRSKGHWIVRTKKPSCREFVMDVDGGSGDCKMTGKIVSEKACP
ncbi:MAG: hypothetical protein V4598_02440 [Bdellovibrionota bacterium]